MDYHLLVTKHGEVDTDILVVYLSAGLWDMLNENPECPLIYFMRRQLIQEDLLTPAR